MEVPGVLENVAQSTKLENDIDEHRPLEAILKENISRDLSVENSSHGIEIVKLSSSNEDKELHAFYNDKEECTEVIQELHVKETEGMQSEGEKGVLTHLEFDEEIFGNSCIAKDSNFNEQDPSSRLNENTHVDDDCIIADKKIELLCANDDIAENAISHEIVDSKPISDAVKSAENEQFSSNSIKMNKDEITVSLEKDPENIYEVKQDEPNAGQSWYVNDGDEEEEDGVYLTDDSYEGECTEDEEGHNRIQDRRRRRVGEQTSEDDTEGINEELSEGECQEVSDDDERLDEQVEGKRFSGDGQEEPKTDKNLVDEDRKNPAYVPRKGTYFEHDLRAQTEDDSNRTAEGKTKKKSRCDDGKWKHDKFDVYEQAPKRTHEIVRKYGYDIRKGHNFSKNHGDSDEFQEEYSQDRKCILPNKEPANERNFIRNNCRREINDSRSASPYIKHEKPKYDDSKKGRSDFNINKSRSTDPKKNQGPGRRGFRREIITTGGRVASNVQVQVDLELHNRTEPSFSREDRKISPKRKDIEKNARIGTHKNVKESSYEGHCDNKNQVVKNIYVQKLPMKDDCERVHAPMNIEGKVNYRSQDQHKQSFREAAHQRPPRLTKQFTDRPPRELEIVNSSMMKGRVKNKISETHLSYCEKEKAKNVNANDFQNSATKSSAPSMQHHAQPAGEGRKGWAGGEFTPSWRSDPQQRKSEEPYIPKASKRYSSSRQQKQYHEVEYYQQYPPYGHNSPAPSGSVYDTMIPHPAFVPHSTLVTNSYAPFYSTLPGNVYPNPPVYQQPQLAPYTNTSYVNHEGPVFYGHQGVPQYFEPPQTVRVTSAIPIVNPQDLAVVKKRGSQQEAVAVCSQ